MRLRDSRNIKESKKTISESVSPAIAKERKLRSWGRFKKTYEQLDSKEKANVDRAIGLKVESSSLKRSVNSNLG